ncbi:hypothetical protein KFK09_016243 [Dendrobium nobile]|uniref:Uncharacterized protein n=1 Tax=Dendrobium nobile TaxID=94219 RepID=A0A8T3AY79_DENNO|nr:hypothetical protein KFK09_016243 [Dendrobium nobile]
MITVMPATFIKISSRVHYLATSLALWPTFGWLFQALMNVCLLSESCSANDKIDKTCIYYRKYSFSDKMALPLVFIIMFVFCTWSLSAILCTYAIRVMWLLTEATLCAIIIVN